MCSLSYHRALDGCPSYVEYFKPGDDVPTQFCELHSGSLKQRAERALRVARRDRRGIRGIFRRGQSWRCWWCGTDPLYVEYHDEEWGKPVTDDNRLFEKICLEGFQAGLSWLTILRKRENFRRAFANFDIDTRRAFQGEGRDPSSEGRRDHQAPRQESNRPSTTRSARSSFAIRKARWPTISGAGGLGARHGRGVSRATC